MLKGHAITFSMECQGQWMDNVFVERLWRTGECEDLNLKAYETLQASQDGLKQFFHFYNTQYRPAVLDRRTPDAVYFGETSLPQAA